MTLPFDVSTGTAVYLAAVIFVSAFLRGYSGFGYPVFVIAAGALVVNPLLLVPVAVMGDLVICALLWRGSRPHVHWPTVIRLIAGSAVGLIVSIWALVLINEDAARIMIGVMVLLASILLFTGWTLPGRAGPSATLGMGVVAGLVVPTGIAGAPAVMLVTALGLSPQMFRATLLAFFVALDLMTLVQFSLAGRVDLQSLTAAALSMPLVVAGVLLGARQVMAADPVVFRRATIAVLMLMAAIGLIRVFV